MDRIDTIIEICDKHLNQTNSRSSPIDAYLSKFLLVSITGKFETDIKKTLMNRICNCNDPHLAKYIDTKFKSYKHLNLSDIRGEILGRFDESLKNLFNQKIKGAPEINYENIINNRNAAAHDKPINLTFKDVANAYKEAMKVIVAFDNVLTVAPHNP